MEEKLDKVAASPAGEGPGQQLRAAREEMGLTLADISARSHIATRHLKMIEKGEFAKLPARTYAIGFARTYARIVGLDAGAVAANVREQLDASDAGAQRHRAAAFEPGDPARIPSRGLGWAAAAAAALLLIGGFTFYRSFFAPGGELPPLREAAPAPKAVAAKPDQADPRPAGSVSFTALEDGIWVKFYDASGRQLMQKQMARGERYTVPAGAERPLLWTGRPDALSITIGGREVPKLAESQGIMKDVPVSAAALLARTSPKAASDEIAKSATSPTG